ncbi:IQ domain-containing protein K-like isoform X2 [Dreissena polymorpha]|uniref:IQ domain-containing protein K-like isoform X2 n=1 Tax=Dreissena polymorpha TaxID=45954 RepID=UPI002263C78E|nr:IQ domain-containing protein K-like isoform X2 [Dreissena polymorpha]
MNREFSGHKRFIEEDESSVLTDYQDFDPAKHNPVFYGQMHTKVPTDANLEEGVNVAITHPSVIGYAFTQKPAKSSTPPPPPIPKKELCSPSEYLELYVFPVLLPAIERMLEQAKKEKCFERKRTKFDALDFLTQFLYNNNPNQAERSKRDLEDIPFVKEWLKDHPRPPLPLSLIWTEEEAAVKIQSFWRGYRVRKEPEIQELRQWQAEWREENGGIQRRVSDFWEKKEKDVGDT